LHLTVSKLTQPRVSTNSVPLSRKKIFFVISLSRVRIKNKKNWDIRPVWLEEKICIKGNWRGCGLERAVSYHNPGVDVEDCEEDGVGAGGRPSVVQGRGGGRVLG
jgi:hypothetical protein